MTLTGARTLRALAPSNPPSASGPRRIPPVLRTVDLDTCH